MIPLDRIGGAPITWGVCEVPGWGVMLSADRVLGEMRSLGITATELGAPGFLPRDPAELNEVLDPQRCPLDRRLRSGRPPRPRPARGDPRRGACDGGAVRRRRGDDVRHRRRRRPRLVAAVRALGRAVGPPRRHARRARRTVRRARAHPGPASARRHPRRDRCRRRHRARTIRRALVPRHRAPLRSVATTRRSSPPTPATASPTCTSRTCVATSRPASERGELSIRAAVEAGSVLPARRR